MRLRQPARQPNRGSFRDLAESEIVVALFRTLVIILVALLPRISQTRVVVTDAAFYFLIGASVYNLLTALLYWRRIRFPYQRHVMLLIDLALVTIYLNLGGLPRNQLFPLYFLVTIVAAMWFKVGGAVLVATVASFLHVYLVSTSGLQTEAVLDALRQSLSAGIPFLYLIALLSGYLSEAQEHERSNLVEARELIDQYENEMRFSRQIHRLLLAGPVPETEGLDVGWRVQPARVNAGGDYFDVLKLADGRLGLCIADVAGKSLDAQIRLPLLKYALRAVAPESGSPGYVVTKLNGLVYQDLQPDMYIGLCYAILDLRNGRLDYCNAGHVPPLLSPANGSELRELTTLGPALGVMPDWDYPEAQAEMGEGDTLVMYTDGVLDARDQESEPYGEARFRSLLHDNRSAEARPLANTLVDTVNEFERGGKHDDLTVLVAKRVAAGGA
ncbi:MAG: hypothetical protein COY42_17805 [Armatimonadetes bacterium CG_4_10_14_0_8_um_filter_66_14]|nr:serine/threonine-protein phosphatase [Armatimonadota bacterium]OIO99948.1 MAG: hypothetical protein AUJ96_18980 [Armatimonadetes bacterium CG2_30_66_41]PIU92607.1 MAG: hypothetical protein COS65_17045 [Armatimonadetes bacterium CG06_land_8_20_14_3_00_66_21]PIZ42329.1 MAG: hypothetical protein COY42_17805 [Armatimonadetes bacterium CG_4_10_14_0_8_um_filter_66_14]PJB61373.1 MAG: hypothetical protein CO096_29220 [Armatimonadetes bacterium CG_4_9_14_3_um_filter_66_14]